MSDLINNIGAAAGEWNRHLVWISVNAGYIKAELPQLDSEGYDVDDIREWLQIYPYLQDNMSKLQLDAYTAARCAEAGVCDTEAVKVPLDKLKSQLRKWLAGMDDLVEQYTRDGVMPAAMLLTACGAEIHGAHQQFVEQVKLFLVILKYTPQVEETEVTEEAEEEVKRVCH